MRISKEKLKELLVQPSIVNEADFNTAVKEAEERKRDFVEILIEKKLVKDDELGQLVANEIGFPFVNLRQEKIDEKELNLIPELVARNKGVIIFGRNEDGIKVGMINPDDLEIRHLLEKKLGHKLLVFYITNQDFSAALAQYQTDLKEEIEGFLADFKSKKAVADKDELFVKIVDLLLRYGYQSKVSDVHIEPYTKKIIVRFRIDGILHDVLELPKNIGEFIIARIKILAKMRTDEHRAAQDGKLDFIADDKKIDVRVSIVPVTKGENIVLRILSDTNRQYNLSDLGLVGVDLKKVENAIARPHGMILVTGPTGSGKTTTLYAVLKILNRKEVHIATIEDPVEYDIEGISQIQVNPKTNLTFAKGLRAILRQDPDIIMVGEIRDKETAGIAVNSALTGHLVLSTVHTNDSATTLPRLFDMGVEPFLVSSTVNIVIAQRLVRKICDKCRTTHNLTDSEQEIIKNDPNVLKYFENKGYKNLEKVIFYKGVGCKACSNTGYIGRIGIFEVLEMSEEVKELVVKRATSDEIMKVACKQGMTTMFSDGLEKVFNGITSFDEILRAVKG